MHKRVTEFEVTEAFVALIEDARRKGETLVLERAGQILCTITPEKQPFTAGDLARWLETIEWPDPDFGGDLEAAYKSQPVEIPRSAWD